MYSEVLRKIAEIIREKRFESSNSIAEELQLIATILDALPDYEHERVLTAALGINTEENK